MPALLDGAGGAVSDKGGVKLPTVVAEADDELEPVVVDFFELTDLELACKAISFELALLSIDDTADADVALIAALADTLALGVIDSTVFELSTTNCCVSFTSSMFLSSEIPMVSSELRVVSAGSVKV